VECCYIPWNMIRNFQMIRKLVNYPLSLPVLTHAALAAAAVIGFILVKPQLDASYAASNHPVDYATGQLSFNGEVLKGYYAHMIKAGTLDIYWQTQFIDFAFIVAVFCLGLFLCTGAARIARHNSWGRHVGMFAAIAAMSGALCDVDENLLSFVMLSNPAGFPNWIAIICSSFSALKFALITAAMGGVVFALAFASFGRLFHRPRVG
jgi:hypothetical protein